MQIQWRVESRCPWPRGLASRLVHHTKRTGVMERAGAGVFDQASLVDLAVEIADELLLQLVRVPAASEVHGITVRVCKAIGTFEIHVDPLLAEAGGIEFWEPEGGGTGSLVICCNVRLPSELERRMRQLERV